MSITRRILKELLKRNARKDYGMRVIAQLSIDGVEKEVQFHNVTEIHYNYPQSFHNKRRTRRVAFESDIHGTGITYDLDWGRMYVIEFEARAEHMKEVTF